VRILLAIEEGKHSGALLARLPAAMPSRDRGLATEIVYGVLRRRAILDQAVACASSRPLARIDPPLLALLRVAAYQILFLERVPPPSAVDEAVGLARRRAGRAAAGFVNGTLRGLLRAGRPRPADIAGPRPQDAGREAGRYREWLARDVSFPRWLVDRVLDRDGATAGEALLRALNRPAPVALRVARRAGGPQAAIDRLAAEGVHAAPSPVLEGALRVVDGVATGTPAFGDGWLYVQDEASQILALMMQPLGAGVSCIDLCAAPGGKSLQCADSEAPPRVLVAADASRTRLRRLVDNARRMRIGGIAPVVMDAAAPAVGRPFDRVLLDAPCSGTGVIRRHPEIRWRLSEDHVRRCAARQARLLRAAADIVAPGGRLVYSVCSLEPEEGGERIDALLAERPALGRLDARVVLPAALHHLVDERGAVVSRPDRHDMDGFFAAILTLC
jgi:16S rRNA (cytosine967-C5)-methyltransferase